MIKGQGQGLNTVVVLVVFCCSRSRIFNLVVSLWAHP